MSIEYRHTQHIIKMTVMEIEEKKSVSTNVRQIEAEYVCFREATYFLIA
jgi:hypothetical protein